MSSSSSNNALIQKNSGFSISLSKLNKQTQDQLEMNSINSSILLNPSAIKNNQPVINQLYQPILRQDSIDLSSISINTFPTNINPHYLLASSFQTQLQPNKLHPYIRTTNSFAGATSSKSNANRTNNSRANGQPASNSSNNSSSSTSTSSNNSNYLVHNLRLSDDLNSSLVQINKPTIANSFDSTNSSRLNDSNWCLNGQLNQLNPSFSQSSKSSNQLNKRNRLINNSKNFMYTDKNAVDSVKKLDKIISNHNKNLQEILRHKNQLIKTITAKQSYSNRAELLPSQFSQINNLNNFNNLNSQLNNLNSHSNSHPNSHSNSHPNSHSNSYSNLNSNLNNLNSHLINHQNQFSSLFVNGKGNRQPNYQSTDYLNKTSNRYADSSSFSNVHHLNQHRSNRRLIRPTNESIELNNLNSLSNLNNDLKNLSETLQNLNNLNNNSLNVLTIAINEEAELNKLKLAKDQKKCNDKLNSELNQFNDKQNSLLSDIIDESIINDNLIVSNNDDIMLNTLDLINSTINSSFNELKSTNNSKPNLKASIKQASTNLVKNNLINNNLVDNNLVNNNLANNNLIKNNLVNNLGDNLVDNNLANNQVKNNLIDNNLINNLVNNSVIKNNLINNNLINKNLITESNLKRKLVSKLDEREARIKKFRNDSFESEIFYIDNGDEFDFENDDEISAVQSDCELNDEYNYRLKSNCILFNPGGKQSPQLTESKLRYLHHIGLTTEQNKERLEFDKFVRTKRTLKEISNVNSNELNSTRGQRSQRSQTLRSNSLRNQTLRNDSSLKRLPVKLINSSLSSTICASLTPMNRLVSDSINCRSKNRSTNRNSENRSPSDQILNECLQIMSKRQVENVYLEPTKVQPDQIRDARNGMKHEFMNQIGLKLETNIERIKLRELNWDGILEDRERRRIFNVCFEKLIDNLDAVTKLKWLNELNEEKLRQEDNLINELKQNEISIDLMCCSNKSRTNSRKNINKQELKTTRRISIESLKLFKNNQQSNKMVKVDRNESNMDRNEFKWPGVVEVIQSYKKYHQEIDDEKLILATKISQQLAKKKELEQNLNNLKIDKNNKQKIIKDLQLDDTKMKKADACLKSCIQSYFKF